MKALSSHPKLVNAITFFNFLAASVDIILRIPIAGTHVRIAQILQIALAGLGFMYIFVRGRIVLPIGIVPLLIWNVWNLISSSSSSNLNFALSYAAWLTCFTVYIIGATQLHYRAPLNIFYRIGKFYIVSFICLATFGVIQFVAGIAGIDLLITQWWFPHLPRVNGLSYEPSYYATYIVIGWTMVLYLLRSGSKMFQRRSLVWFLVLTSVAMLISSSRIGVVFCSVTLVSIFVTDLIKSAMRGNIRTLALNTIILLFFIFASLVLFYVGADMFDFSESIFLLEGTGLFGTAAHSAERFDDTWQTLSLWFEEPWFGHGLGGVWVKMGEMVGLPPTEATGMNVFAEILAGTGVFGFLLFIYYVAQNLRACFRNYDWNKYDLPNSELKKFLRALGFALVAELIVLQFNQNILRIYVWNHFSIISVMAAATRHSFERA